jgi:hypothetical protein
MLGLTLIVLADTVWATGRSSKSVRGLFAVERDLQSQLFGRDRFPCLEKIYESRLTRAGQIVTENGLMVFSRLLKTKTIINTTDNSKKDHFILAHFALVNFSLGHNDAQVYGREVGFWKTSKAVPLIRGKAYCHSRNLILLGNYISRRALAFGTIYKHFHIWGDINAYRMPAISQYDSQDKVSPIGAICKIASCGIYRRKSTVAKFRSGCVQQYQPAV